MNPTNMTKTDAINCEGFMVVMVLVIRLIERGV